MRIKRKRQNKNNTKKRVTNEKVEENLHEHSEDHKKIENLTHHEATQRKIYAAPKREMINKSKIDYTHIVKSNRENLQYDFMRYLDDLQERLEQKQCRSSVTTLPCHKRVTTTTDEHIRRAVKNKL